MPVTGGIQNVTLVGGKWASVLGGAINTAGGDGALVGGGYRNKAVAFTSTVLGGKENEVPFAAGHEASVFGGKGHGVVLEDEADFASLGVGT